MNAQTISPDHCLRSMASRNQSTTQPEPNSLHGVYENHRSRFLLQHPTDPITCQHSNEVAQCTCWVSWSSSSSSSPLVTRPHKKHTYMLVLLLNKLLARFETDLQCCCCRRRASYCRLYDVVPQKCPRWKVQGSDWVVVLYSIRSVCKVDGLWTRLLNPRYRSDGHQMATRMHRTRWFRQQVFHVRVCESTIGICIHVSTRDVL